MLFIKNIKKFFFPFYKTREIREIFKILNHDKKNNAMLVGGCVRNFLNNEKIGDIDIATIFTPEEVIKKFSNTDFSIIKSGIDHGTVTLSKDGEDFQITTLREDISTDGRHAKVSFTKDWKVDSERRDFTINAIYLDHTGKIYDPQNGQDDLKNKIVKFIGDPTQRIKEDYLRILRYIRFSIHYHSKIEESTIKIIKLNLNGFSNLSKERVYVELLKIISLKNFKKNILNSSHLIEIFSLIFPEFKYIKRLEKAKKLLNYELSKEDLLGILILDRLGNHEYFCFKYKVPNKLRERFKFIAEGLVKIKVNKNFFKNDIKKNLYIYGKELMIDLNLIDYFESKKKNYNNYNKILGDLKKISIPVFPYDGKFLINKGFSEGKKIGQVMKEIEKKWIENEFKLNDEQIGNLIKKYI